MSEEGVKSWQKFWRSFHGFWNIPGNILWFATLLGYLINSYLYWNTPKAMERSPKFLP